ncbi:MAG: FlgD immunoglobulin-like domain containing protein, partial [bacterium]
LLRVYDAGGRLVRTLSSGRQKPGAYVVTWDGSDGQGRAVPNGIYFYRLDAPGYKDVKKAVVMR